MKVFVQFELKPEIVQSLLVDCFEGGYSQWIRGAERVAGDYDPKENLVWYVGQDGFVRGEDGDVKPFRIRLIYDREEDDEGAGKGKATLDRAAIAFGIVALSKVAPATFTRIITQEGDALDADAFMQCCVFGKIIYG